MFLLAAVFIAQIAEREGSLFQILSFLKEKKAKEGAKNVPLLKGDRNNRCWKLKENFGNECASRNPVCFILREIHLKKTGFFSFFARHLFSI